MAIEMQVVDDGCLSLYKLVREVVAAVVQWRRKDERDK
jgi:hypothetical protein